MFAIKTDTLHRINCVKEAENKYNNTVPKPSGVRPLGNRRDDNKSIVKGKDAYGTYYAAKLYNTEVVKYYDDGTILLDHDGFITQSTALFIHAIAPVTLARLFDNNLVVTLFHGMGTYLVPRGGLRLHKFLPAGGRLDVVNPPSYYTRGLNREETRRLRRLPAAAAVDKYLRTLGKLGAWVAPFGFSAGRATAIRMMLIELVERPDTTPSLAKMAEFGDATAGKMPWGAFYEMALTYGLTTKEALYVERPWHPHYPLCKGIFIKKERE